MFLTPCTHLFSVLCQVLNFLVYDLFNFFYFSVLIHKCICDESKGLKRALDWNQLTEQSSVYSAYYVKIKENCTFSIQFSTKLTLLVSVISL